MESAGSTIIFQICIFPNAHATVENILYKAKALGSL